jgi:predicted nuclease of predicted toxin-antitoxin system
VRSWLAQVLSGSCVVRHVVELGLATATDAEVFRAAQDSRSTIITFDEDFADQRLFPIGHHFGIVRLRVQPTTAEVTCEALARLFEIYKPASLVGKLVIVQTSRIRIIAD